MKVEDNEAESYKWLFQPVTNLRIFLDREATIAALAQRAIYLVRESPWLLKATVKSTGANKSRLLALQRLLNASHPDAQFAEEEIGNGFSTILSHSAVGTWAAIETAIEQTLVNHTMRVPNPKDRMMGVAPSLKVQRIRLESEDDARWTVRRWEGSLKIQNNV